jgi:predicted DNA-binding ribbon-helix-helix protein
MAGKKVTIYLEEELIKKTKKIAVDEDTSMSKIVGELLEEYIKKHKGK